MPEPVTLTLTPEQLARGIERFGSIEAFEKAVQDAANDEFWRQWMKRITGVAPLLIALCLALAGCRHKRLINARVANEIFWRYELPTARPAGPDSVYVTVYPWRFNDPLSQLSMVQVCRRE